MRSDWDGCVPGPRAAGRLLRSAPACSREAQSEEDPEAGAGASTPNGDEKSFTRVNWPLPDTAFKALAFDSQGQPIILGEDRGLARLEGTLAKTGAALAFDEPEGDYRTDLDITKDIAVLGTEQHGLVLWNLRTRKRGSWTCLPPRLG
ncbi:MAG: hypothetical protein MZV70_17230 [Desulfobacterales bacterium]|nr:hypothetical protein [Desulfobacterales bacterium]